MLNIVFDRFIYTGGTVLWEWTTQDSCVVDTLFYLWVPEYMQDLKAWLYSTRKDKQASIA